MGKAKAYIDGNKVAVLAFKPTGVDFFERDE